MNKSEPILRPCLYKIAHNARSSRRASWPHHPVARTMPAPFCISARPRPAGRWPRARWRRPAATPPSRWPPFAPPPPAPRDAAARRPSPNTRSISCRANSNLEIGSDINPPHQIEQRERPSLRGPGATKARPPRPLLRTRSDSLWRARLAQEQEPGVRGGPARGGGGLGPMTADTDSAIIRHRKRKLSAGL